MPKPFRWSVAKREQLGSFRSAEHFRPTAEHVSELRATAARVLALSDGANLAFIGRSPENFFDYLSGAFADLSDVPKLHLVQFSMRGLAPDENPHTPDNLAAIGDYFRLEGIDPAAIAKGERPIALVDVVAYGGTMKNFVEILHLLAKRDGVDWTAVQRRLRIIGLVSRTKNSPKTWRWHQHQDWLDLIPDAKIQNVSASEGFTVYITGFQSKVTESFYLSRWTEPVDGAPSPTDDQRAAIAFAADLYDIGNTRDEREALAAAIAKTQQMRGPATRALVLALRGGRKP
jgi:hypothetical protein